MKIRTGILESDKIYHCLFRLMSGSPRHVVNFRRLNISIPKIKTITPKQEKSGMQLPNLRSSCVNRPSALINSPYITLLEKKNYLQVLRTYLGSLPCAINKN